MWMPLTFRPFLISGILHFCQYALHQLHDKEGKKKMEEFVRRNFYSHMPETVFINHYAKDEHDMISYDF